MAVLGIAAVGLVAKAVRPYREISAAARDLSATEQEIAALRAENASLAQQMAYLQRPDGQTALARRFGYVKPGERPFAVKSAAPAPAGRPAAPAPTSRPSFLDPARRWLRPLTHWIGGPNPL